MIYKYAFSSIFLLTSWSHMTQRKANMTILIPEPVFPSYIGNSHHHHSSVNLLSSTITRLWSITRDGIWTGNTNSFLYRFFLQIFRDLIPSIQFFNWLVMYKPSQVGVQWLPARKVRKVCPFLSAMNQKAIFRGCKYSGVIREAFLQNEQSV